PHDNYLITAGAPRAVVLGALLAAWLGGRVLRGITSIVSATAEMTHHGDFSRRLIERVDRVLPAQRQLVADTSHKLPRHSPLLGKPKSVRAEVLVDTRQEVARLTRPVCDAENRPTGA